MIWTLRNLRVVGVEVFFDHREALEAVGSCGVGDVVEPEMDLMRSIYAHGFEIRPPL